MIEVVLPVVAEQPLIPVFMNDSLIGYWRPNQPDTRTRIDVPDFKSLTPMKIESLDGRRP